MGRVTVLIVAALAFAGIALAQTPPGIAVVTAGEHPRFTRVVVAARDLGGWSLTPEGRLRRLALQPAAIRIDIARVFDRIPRSRLGQVRVDGASLVLSLACDCRVDAWQERPGLIVIDISDPDQAGGSGPVATGRPPGPAAPDLTEVARRAGLALAQTLAAEVPTGVAPAPEQLPLPDAEGLIRDLGLPIARALGQGLLEPAVQGAAAPVVLPDADGFASALPANMRIDSALIRPDPGVPPPAAPANGCQGSEALDTLARPRDTAFAEELAALTRALYGEFDQPDPGTRRALVDLYLSAGFGAEARALIVNDPDPVVARDLLLGVSDILEGRSSNSRMRLAGALDCGGVAAVFALLASGSGAPPASGLPGDEIALTFARMPPQLRTIIGPALVDALLLGAAADAARVVADSLRRSPWTPPAAMTLIDAALDRARGQTAAAAERLERAAPADAAALLARLQLALATGRRLPAEVLADVEALASAERDSGIGPELLASLIRLLARDGALDAGFAAFDRLDTWLADTGSNARLRDGLVDALWRAQVDASDDAALIRRLLARPEWQSGGFSDGTRAALAARLVALGLYDPVADLLPYPASADEAVIRARAALGLGQPGAALALVATHDTNEARAVRAAALAAAGDPGSAAAEYAVAGAAADAAHAAVLARDWERLATLPGVQGHRASLARLLGRQPGTDPGAEPEGEPRTAPGSLGEPRPAAAAAPVANSPGRATDDDSGQPAIAPPPSAAPVTAAPAPSGTMTPVAAETATAPPAPVDPSSPDDRRGMIGRSAALLAESEHLRASLRPLLDQSGPEAVGDPGTEPER